MEKILILLMAGCVCLSCSNNQHTETSLTFDLDKTEQVSVNDLFQSVDIIPLETNNQCLISHVTKVILHENRYYLFDVRQQAVFCFDASGKHLFTISRRGQGPEEYVYLDDFNIDPFNQQLLLLESFGSLLIFNLDGKFISKTHLPTDVVAYNEVHAVNKDTLLFHSLNKYGSVTYSKSKDELIDKKEAGFNNNIFSPLHKTYAYNDTLFFAIPGTNQVMNLVDQSVFTWDFGDRNNAEQQLREVKELITLDSNMKRVDFVKEGVLNYYFYSRYECDRYKIGILEYESAAELKHIFFDKLTNQVVVFDRTTEGIQFLVPFFSAECVILTEQPVASKYYDDCLLSEKQQQIVHARSADDNPFLVRYNFKK